MHQNQAKPTLNYNQQAQKHLWQLTRPLISDLMKMHCYSLLNIKQGPTVVLGVGELQLYRRHSK